MENELRRESVTKMQILIYERQSAWIEGSFFIKHLIVSHRFS